MSRDADDIREGNEITLRHALTRIVEASPANTNSRSAESMASWCRAVAATALEGATRIDAPRDTAGSAEDEAFVERMYRIYQGTQYATQKDADDAIDLIALARIGARATPASQPDVDAAWVEIESLLRTTLEGPIGNQEARLNVQAALCKVAKTMRAGHAATPERIAKPRIGDADVEYWAVEGIWPAHVNNLACDLRDTRAVLTAAQAEIEQLRANDQRIADIAKRRIGNATASRDEARQEAKEQRDRAEAAEAEATRLREALATETEACAQRVSRFQDIVGWQPGESRNALIGEIEDAIRARKAAP